MIKKLVLILFILAYSSISFSQVNMQHVKEDESKMHRLDGTALLWKEDAKVTQYIKDHPETIEKSRLQKTSGWGFTVGSQKVWYSVDYTTSGNQLYPVQSTCRAVGQNCYIFVEDSIWGTRVTQSGVDSVRTAFDIKTPADPTKGIYQTLVESFGNPPDVDNDPKIIILLLNIKDNFATTKGYIAGYFYSYNEVASYPNSAGGEILFVDANPINLASSTGVVEAMSTAAHEFQHMIHWNYKHGTQLTFVNESCSLVSEVICGYPLYDQTNFQNDPNTYLFTWRPVSDSKVYVDYSRAARFGLYIKEQFGQGIFNYIVKSNYSGIDAYNDAFQKTGSSLRFDEVFTNWSIANALNDKTINPAYGYSYKNMQRITGTVNMNPNVPKIDESVEKVSAQYITYKEGKNLKIKFTPGSIPISIKAAERGTGQNRLLSVTPGVDFSESEYGTTYKEINFVVINTNHDNGTDFSYSSTGSTSITELKWDETEPTGYYNLTASDTVCVAFDAVSGAKIDSVKIALRRAGSITGGVFRYTGNVRPTPLGARLAVPITATSTINPEPPSPYPVPYPNWVSVDIRSFDVKGDYPFAVAFTIQDYKIPGVMATKYLSASSYHSYTYLNSPGSGSSPNWYVLSASTTEVILWCIRAYASFGSSDVVEPVEALAKGYSLEQNYPNPFNPSTIIEFSVPKAGFVSLKVYNSLGEEVATLVSTELQAGKYRFGWSPKGLVSGTYFYKIVSGDYSETKKLVLLK